MVAVDLLSIAVTIRLRSHWFFLDFFGISRNRFLKCSLSASNLRSFKSHISQKVCCNYRD